MIPWLVVLPSSCRRGCSSREVLFGFRAFLLFSVHKHSSHPDSNFLSQCQDDQALAFPTSQRHEGLSALRGISGCPALLCYLCSITLDSLVPRGAETS